MGYKALHKKKLRAIQGLEEEQDRHLRVMAELECALKDAKGSLETFYDKLGLNGLHIAIAEEIVHVNGVMQVTSAEGRQMRKEVVLDAIKDIQFGERELCAVEGKFYAITLRAGREYREDHQYGFRPLKGEMVFTVGIKLPARRSSLHEYEIRAVVHYLANLERIQKIQRK